MEPFEKPDRKKSSLFGEHVAFWSSCTLHLGCCLILACLYAGGGGGKRSGSFELLMDDFSDSESLTDLTLETPSLETESPIPEEPVTESAIPARLTGYETILFDDSLVNESSTESISEGLKSVLMKTNSSAVNSNAEGKKVAKFYGTELSGSRFVFVIDSSSSMTGPRWQSLKEELVDCIKNLSQDQYFFVVSFDSECKPMFGQLPPKGKFLHPTSSNIQKLQTWLNSIRLGSSTLPASSLALALSLQPDAVMLLSDGEIADDSIAQLRRLNRTWTDEDNYSIKVPIHTYLLDSLVGYRALQIIAEENDGVFTPINLNARRKQRR
jgi:hypothetical protein